MQISSPPLFSYTQPTISTPVVKSLIQNTQPEKETSPTKDALSGVSAFAMSMQISELNFN
jgi:hypothetical protein